MYRIWGTSKNKSHFQATRSSSCLLYPRWPTVTPCLLAQASPSAWTACPLMFSQPATLLNPPLIQPVLNGFLPWRFTDCFITFKNTNLCMHTDDLGDSCTYYSGDFVSALCSIRLVPCNEPMERMVRRERKAEREISNTLSCYLDCHGWAEAFLRGTQGLISLITYSVQVWLVNISAIYRVSWVILLQEDYGIQILTTTGDFSWKNIKFQVLLPGKKKTTSKSFISLCNEYSIM